MRLLSAITTLCTLIATGYGFEEGAPPGACIDMYPRHGYAPQSGNGGFSITVSKTSITAGEIITVTLQGSKKMKGFIMRAEAVAGNTERPLGKFVTVPAGVKKQAWYPASGDWTNDLNCVTHSKEIDVKSVQVTWQAPGSLSNIGEIRFRATALTHFEEFWVDILSAKISTATTAASWTGRTNELSFSAAPSVPSECGSTMGCLLYPRWCKNTGTCTTFLTWNTSTTEVTFTMMAPATGYVSMGISSDTEMEYTQTFTCSYQSTPNMVLIANGYNPPNVPDGMMNFRHTLPSGMKDSVVAKPASYVYCSFTIPKVMNFFYQTSFTEAKNTKAATKTDLNNMYYYFIAQGSVYPGTNIIQEHEGLPVTSDTKIDLKQNKIYYGQAIPIMVRAHGALMLISWLLVACFCMATARYMKNGFGKMIKGVKLWFHLHKFGMAGVYVTALIGVIIIIVYAEGWIDSTVATVHGVFGIICMVVATGQVISGILRPGLDHPNRPIFAWYHKISALICFVTATITIFIVGFVSALPKPFKDIMLGCTIAWIILNIIFIILFEVLGKTKKTQESIPGTDSTMQIAEKEESSSKISRIIIIVYAIILIILSIVIIVSLCAY